MKTLISTILTCLLAHQFLMAQYALNGKVIDTETGLPLAGAHIVIEKTYKTAVSSQDGSFLIQNLPSGNHILKVSYIGYETEMENVSLTGDQTLEIRMEPSAIMASEVVVTATRAAAGTPATFSTVSRIEIDRVNLGQDMPFLLQTTPSVVTSSDAGTGIGYSSLRIRGTDLNRINVTINGIPLNDAESHGVWWVDLPDFASSVESIQIQRGVGTSSNGAAAFGASINIRTDDPEAEPYGEVSLAGGSFMTGKMTLRAGTGLIRDRWALDGRFSRIYSDGYIDRAFADLSSFAFSGGYFGKKIIVRLLVFSGNEKTYQAWDGVPSYMLDSNRIYNGLGAYYDNDGNLKYYDDQTDNYRQTHYHLNWITRLRENWDLSAALHYTRGIGYYEEYKMDQPFSDYQLENVIIGLDTITQTDLIRRRYLDNHFYGFTFGMNHDNHAKLKLNIGGAINYYQGDHYGEVIWSEISAGFDKGYKWYKNDGDKAEGSLFGKITYQAFQKLSFYGDLQFRLIDYRIAGIDNDLRDIAQQHSYLFFNPKLGAYIDFNPANHAYLSLGIGNREPNRTTLVDADPERPSPTAETLYNLEAGYKFASSNISANANLFCMYYKDQLVLTGRINDVGDPVMENVPESYRTGIELQFGFILTKSLRLDLNGTFSTSKIIGFSEYVDNWDDYPDQVVNDLGKTDIAFSPNIIAGSSLQWEPVNRLSVTLFSKFVGKQYIDNTSSSERMLDAYFVNDVYARYSLFPEFMDELTFTVRINNIFNEKYETNAWVYRYYSEGTYGEYNGYFPQAGINFLAGISLNF